MNDLARDMKESGQEWIGLIPENWSISRIASLYSLRNEKVSDKDYPPLSVTMKGIVPQLESAAKSDDSDNRKLVRKGDFAINSRSDRRGSCGISKYDGSVSLINTVLTPRGEMHPGYYDWLFHTVMFADEFYKWGHGIVDDLWTTRWQEMKRILVPVPDIAEQTRISDFLDDYCSQLDAVVAEATRTIDEYKDWKAAIILEATTKGIRGDVEVRKSEIPWFPTLPKHWQLVSAGKLFREDVRPALENDISLSLSQIDGLIPTDEMQERSLKTSSFENWKHVIPDDLVLNRFKAHLGVFFKSNYEGMVSFHYGVYHQIRKDVNPKYYEYLFHSDLYRNIFAILSNGVTVGLQNLGNKVFYSTKVLFPSYEEQCEIVEFLDEKITAIDEIISEKQKLIEDIEILKKSIVFEYVTGKRKVV